MQKRILIGAILVAVILVALWAFRGGGPESGQAYRLAPIELGTLRRVVNATGAVHTVHSVDVGSQLSGKIEAVYVDFNDLVQAGQKIALLDQLSFTESRNAAIAALEVAVAEISINEAGVDFAKNALAQSESSVGVYTAQIKGARALMEEAQKSLDRSMGLSKQGLLSQKDLDRVKAGLVKSTADYDAAVTQAEAHQSEVATVEAEFRIARGRLAKAQSLIPQREARLRMAEVELERSIIRSPIDGIIIDRTIEPGQTVAASLEAPKMFTIAQDLKTMEVHTLIDESDIGQIKLGQRATFSVDAHPGRDFEGEVRQIRKSPRTNRGVVRYVTVIATENADLALLPGMTALVNIITFESGEVVKIPSAALRFQPSSASADDGGTQRVWIPGWNQSPVPVAVRLGGSDMTHTELIEGELKPGDQVIVGQ